MLKGLIPDRTVAQRYPATTAPPTDANAAYDRTLPTDLQSTEIPGFPPGNPVKRDGAFV